MGLFDKISGKAKKQEALYSAYADSHGLARSKDELPPLTKSLEGEITTNERFDGQLSPEFQGTVALVETTIRSSTTVVTTEQNHGMMTGLPEGSFTSSVESSAKAYPATVVMIPLAEVSEALSGLAVKKNYHQQSMGQNDSYGGLPRLAMDGTGLDGSIYVFADEGADPERVRQLFSADFSAWINQRPEKFFGFEFGQGTLVTKNPKLVKNAEELDAHVETAVEIARRLKASAQGA